jgi:chemotaxis protein CheD
MNTLMGIAEKEKTSFVVGMGEIVVSAVPDAVLACIGLGSCIAVCGYDRRAKVGGMVHVVIPQANDPATSNPAKFADTAVPLLLYEMIKAGANRNWLTIKIAGGAQMTIAAGLKNVFNTGEKNVAQIITSLEKEKMALTAADVGGSLGRTVRMYLDTGRITIKSVTGEIREL